MNINGREINFESLISAMQEKFGTGKPRMYQLKFTEGLSFEDCVRALYAILDMSEINNPELSINNKEPKQYDSKYLFPRDMYALNVSTKNKRSEEEVLQAYISNRVGASVVFSFDKQDKNRMTIALLPEKIFEDPEAKEIFGDNYIQVSVFNGVEDRQMDCFINKWFEILMAKQII